MPTPREDFWKNRRVVVTGGAGFLGSVVCRKLQQRGCKNVLVPRSKDYDLIHEQMVQQMFRHCRKGTAFNSLSAWSPHKDADEFYANPLETLEFCRTLTPRLVLRHEYHQRDFTLLLHK